MMDWGRHQPECKTPAEREAQRQFHLSFYKAIICGQLHEVRRFVEQQGGDVNSVLCESAACTPLHTCVLQGHSAIVDYLVSVRGIQIDKTIPEGHTALHLSCQFGRLQIVRSLIRAEADVNKDGGGDLSESPLTLACANGHPAIVDALIAAGANAKYVRPDGTTPLHMASLFGNTELHKAHARRQGVSCDTISSRMVTSLLASGAQVDLIDCHGHTALMMASRYGNTQSVRALLSAKANPLIETRTGATALSAARKCNYTDIIALLEARIADL